MLQKNGIDACVCFSLFCILFGATHVQEHMPGLGFFCQRINIIFFLFFSSDIKEILEKQQIR
jgi:hypothetical protein